MARRYCKKCGKIWYSDETKCPSCSSADVKISGSSYGATGIAVN